MHLLAYYFICFVLTFSQTLIQIFHVSFIFGYYLSLMKAHRIIRVGFEEVYLLLEFEGVGPVVISLAEGYILATSFGEDKLLEHASHALGVEIFLVEDGENLIGVFFCIFADDFRGAIGRAIIVDDDFNGEIALLHQESIQTLPDERSVVVCDATDTDERCFHIT